MACKPRRRRHNKQKPAYKTSMMPNGVVENIPTNRAAFKEYNRVELQLMGDDRATIKAAIFGLADGEKVFIQKDDVHIATHAGYYDNKMNKIPKPLKGKAI